MSEIGGFDKANLITHFQVKEIHDNMMYVPFPYTEKDAADLIDLFVAETRVIGFPVSFAIRREDGKLIGGIWLYDYNRNEGHQAEISYWLAKQYWGRGIMTDAVKSFAKYIFDNLEVVRLTAHVFHFNQSSARVLEKAGFQLEGLLRNHYCKDGKIFDGKLYARIPS